MFYYLKGELAYRNLNTCVIDCGGVGYQLTVSHTTSDELVTKVGKTVKLYTHLAVREDGIELFGFGSNEERECFDRLTSVSGVGPKVAMNVLSTMTPDKLALAICTEDIKAISKTPGIGPKVAARIVLELKDKVSKEMLDSGSKDALSAVPTATLTGNSVIAEATEALAVLGYDKNTILTALNGVDPTIKDAGEMIRYALKRLAR